MATISLSGTAFFNISASPFCLLLSPFPLSLFANSGCGAVLAKAAAWGERERSNREKICCTSGTRKRKRRGGNLCSSRIIKQPLLALAHSSPFHPLFLCPPPSSSSFFCGFRATRCWSEDQDSPCLEVLRRFLVNLSRLLLLANPNPRPKRSGDLHALRSRRRITTRRGKCKRLLLFSLSSPNSIPFPPSCCISSTREFPP